MFFVLETGDRGAACRFWRLRLSEACNGGLFSSRGLAKPFDTRRTFSPFSDAGDRGARSLDFGTALFERAREILIHRSGDHALMCGTLGGLLIRAERGFDVGKPLFCATQGRGRRRSVSGACRRMLESSSGYGRPPWLGRRRIRWLFCAATAGVEDAERSNECHMRAS